jgi:hypothetical protein
MYVLSVTYCEFVKAFQTIFRLDYYTIGSIQAQVQKYFLT